MFLIAIMENSLAGGIVLKNEIIIVNIIKESWNAIQCIWDQKRKSKTPQNNEAWNKGESELKTTKIYSIKDMTKNNTELQMTDIIKYELELKDDGIYIWNRILIVITQISLRKLLITKVMKH